MARHRTGGSSSPSPFSSLRGSELHLSLASTQHPGQPGRRPALEQAQEVRSQPLTAIRKLGEACQALPVEGPAQSSILAQLEFQAGMFSRWAVGQVQIPEAEVNALQRSFPAVSLQPPAGPSWEREGSRLLDWNRATGTWEAASPRSRRNRRCTSCAGHFIHMWPLYGSSWIQYANGSQLHFFPLSFLDYSLSLHT